MFLNAGDVTEKALEVTRSLVAALGHEVPVSKREYLEMGHTLADRGQKVQSKSEVTTRELAANEAKIEEFELKETDVSVLVSDLKKQFAVWDA